MDNLWTWSGKFFGYRQGDALRTYRGHHIGYFVGDDAFSLDGRYLGEAKDNRLITNRSKKNLRAGSVAQYAKNTAIVKFVDYVGFVMYAGYEDFPPPEHFEV
jgi:hypothetical protein